MKKILLFLCVIGVAAMMTSCLERSNSFHEAAVVYIAEAENGVRYGRTSIGRLITSSQIQQGHLTPPGTGAPIMFMAGDFFVMQYEWEEANGYTELGERLYAYNVSILGMTNRLAQVHLLSAPAPEPIQRFTELDTPVFADNPVYWSDNWVISYSFIGGGDIAPTLSFYKREIPENPADDVTIDIDVRIEIPQVASPQLRGNSVVLNMADLRRELQQENDRGVIVRFHFYQPDSDTPSSITSRRWLIEGTSQQ